MKLFRLLGTLTTGLALWACNSSEPIDPTIPVPVASVQAGPTGLMLQIGGTKQLTAITRDAAGQVLTGRVVSWSTDSPLVATVNDSGLVTGVGHGYATIIVASEGRTFGVAVTVEAKGP
jgi:uncharacterized protein YjdB